MKRVTGYKFQPCSAPSSLTASWAKKDNCIIRFKGTILTLFCSQKPDKGKAILNAQEMGWPSIKHFFKMYFYTCFRSCWNLDYPQAEGPGNRLVPLSPDLSTHISRHCGSWPETLILEWKQNETKQKHQRKQTASWDAGTHSLLPLTEGTRKNVHVKISIWQKHRPQTHQQVANAELCVVARADGTSQSYADNLTFSIT